MVRLSRRICFVILVSCVAGCGVNTLRTEYAGDVASDGSAIAPSSDAFLHQVESSRRLANIEMVVADPACGRTPAFVRGSIKMAQNAPGWLCLAPGEPKQPADRQLSMAPLSSDVQPTIMLISALSAYTRAIADIVDSRPSDPMKPLLEALATARSAEGSLAVTGSQSVSVPAADDQRVTAITNFVGFVAQLSNQTDQVTRLRQFVARNRDGVQPLIELLQDQLATWENSRKADDGLRIVVNGAILRRTLDADPPVPAQARRASLTTFYRIQDAVGAAGHIYPALSKSLSELSKADSDLRRVLVENPKLTKAERAKVAETNRQYAMTAMDTVAALIISFKGE